jgi:hypothetical protein
MTTGNMGGFISGSSALGMLNNVFTPTTTVIINMSSVNCQFFTEKDMSFINNVYGVG